MKRGRWIAVGVCTVLIGATIALVYLLLSGSKLRFVAVVAVALFAVTPFAASWLSDHPTPLVAAGGGLACGIAATLAAAAIRQGGTGALPLTLGVAVAGMIALRGTSHSARARIIAIAVLGVYAFFSDRLLSAAFAYPVLGMADEFADIFAARSAREATS